MQVKWRNAWIVVYVYGFTRLTQELVVKSKCALQMLRIPSIRSLEGWVTFSVSGQILEVVEVLMVIFCRARSFPVLPATATAYRLPLVELMSPVSLNSKVPNNISSQQHLFMLLFADICHMNPITSMSNDCRFMGERWYFDVKEGYCRSYYSCPVYGNNFPDEETCNTACRPKHIAGRSSTFEVFELVW